MFKFFGDDTVSELMEKLKIIKKREDKKCCDMWLALSIAFLVFAIIIAVVLAVKLYLKRSDEYEGFSAGSENEENDDDNDNGNGNGNGIEAGGSKNTND